MLLLAVLAVTAVFVHAEPTGYTWLPPALTSDQETLVRAVVGEYTGAGTALVLLGRAQEDSTVFLVGTGLGTSMWCVDLTAGLDSVESETTVQKTFGALADETFAHDYHRATLAGTAHTAAAQLERDSGRTRESFQPEQPPPTPEHVPVPSQ